MNGIVTVVLKRLEEKYPDDPNGNMDCIADQIGCSNIDDSDLDIMIAVITMQVRHRYQGFCPELLNGEMRDPYCIACECTNRLLKIMGVTNG